jgi:hypothetical protein
MQCFLKSAKYSSRLEKRREVTAYNQQAYRRYNHVKTQGWSLYGLPIHAFSIFNDVFEYF